MDEISREPVRGGAFPAELLGLSGVEQLRLFLSGKVPLPPIHYLTGMRPTEVGVGSATFTMPITGWLQTPQGLAIGGDIAILADGPLGCAIQTVLPPATGYTTSELSINLVRPVPRSGQLIARGRLVHGGRQLALSEAFVTDDAGRLIAHGTSRCVVFPPAPDVHLRRLKYAPCKRRMTTGFPRIGGQYTAQFWSNRYGQHEAALKCCAAS